MFIGPLISPRASIPSNHVFNFLTMDMISGGGKKGVLRCIQTNFTKIHQDQEKYHCFHHCSFALRFGRLMRLCICEIHLHIGDICKALYKIMLSIGCRYAFILTICADMHSYLQYMPICIMQSYLRCMPPCRCIYVDVDSPRYT